MSPWFIANMQIILSIKFSIRFKTNIQELFYHWNRAISHWFFIFKEIQPWKWAILNEPYVICDFVSNQNSRWRWQINFMAIKIKRCYSPCGFPLANGQPMIGTPWLILSITEFHPVMGKKCSNRFVWQNFQLGRPVIH